MLLFKGTSVRTVTPMKKRLMRIARVPKTMYAIARLLILLIYNIRRALIIQY